MKLCKLLLLPRRDFCFSIRRWIEGCEAGTWSWMSSNWGRVSVSADGSKGVKRRRPAGLGCAVMVSVSADGSKGVKHDSPRKYYFAKDDVSVSADGSKGVKLS